MSVPLCQDLLIDQTYVYMLFGCNLMLQDKFYVCVCQGCCLLCSYTQCNPIPLCCSLVSFTCVGVGPFLLIDALMIEYSKPLAN